MKHSASFVSVRDAIFALEDDRDRVRLAGLFGFTTTRPHRKVGELRPILRAIAALDDDDLEKLAKWSSTWVNNWARLLARPGYGSFRGAQRDPGPDQ